MFQKIISYFYKKFQQSSRKRQIAVCVWGFHFFVLLTLLIHHAAIRSFKPSRPIAIRTIAPSPQKNIVSKPAPPQKSSSRTPQKQTAAKKTAALAKPQPTAKPKTPTPKTMPAKDHTLDDLAAALSILDKPPGAKRLEIEVPSEIKIQQPSISVISAPSYGEFLVGYLQESLDLPEYGEVKVKLLISREGNLLESSVLASENPKNSEFLKNRLPELSFPCFNDFNIDEKSLTFTISFRNAENIR